MGQRYQRGTTLRYKWSKNSLTGEVIFELNPATGQRILTGFGKEIEFMDNLVTQGIYQWDGLNGIYKYVGN